MHESFQLLKKGEDQGEILFPHGHGSKGIRERIPTPLTPDRMQLTLASWSKRPKSSLRRRTSSCAEHCDDSTVNPTISAKRMLQRKKGQSEGNGNRYDATPDPGVILDAECEALSHLPFQHLILRATN